MLADEKTRAELVHLEESRRDIDSERINAERLAEERGREEGIAEERRKNALNMKSKGFDNKLIAECLGITEGEVKAILKQ